MARAPVDELFVVVPPGHGAAPLSAILLDGIVPVLNGVREEGFLARWLYNHKTVKAADGSEPAHLFALRLHWRSVDAGRAGQEALLARLGKGEIAGRGFYATRWPSFWPAGDQEASRGSLEKRFGGPRGARIYRLFGLVDTGVAVEMARALERGALSAGSLGGALTVLYRYMDALRIAASGRAAFLERAMLGLMSPPLSQEEARARVRSFQEQAAAELKRNARLREFVGALSAGSFAGDPVLERLLAKRAARLGRIGKLLEDYAGRGAPGVPDLQLQASIYIQMHFSRRFLPSHKCHLVRAIAWVHERGRR